MSLLGSVRGGLGFMTPLLMMSMAWQIMARECAGSSKNGRSLPGLFGLTRW